MLRIRIELVPRGFGEPIEIGRMLIANVGKNGVSDPKHANYKAKLARKGQTDERKIWRKPQREELVTNHARLSLSVWKLVARALHSMGFEGHT